MCTRYFHTPIEWLVAVGVACVVLQGYMLLYDNKACTLARTCAPAHSCAHTRTQAFLGRHSKLLLLGLFMTCFAFVLLICPYFWFVFRCHCKPVRLAIKGCRRQDCPRGSQPITSPSELRNMRAYMRRLRLFIHTSLVVGTQRVLARRGVGTKGCWYEGVLVRRGVGTKEC